MQAHGSIDENILKKTLDAFYRSYDPEQNIFYDPVEFPHRYKRPSDIETAGFIAACFSYGRVELFKPVIHKILSIAGSNLHEFISNFDAERDANLFEGVKYRMNTAKDIMAFIHLLSVMMRKYDSPGKLFRRTFNVRDPNIINALSGFVKEFYSGDTSAVYGKKIYPHGLLQLLPSPDKGSSCKRSNMFLRWMVRNNDGVDFGLWTFIPSNKLIIPLDTHIARIARHLALTKRKTTDIKTAMDITDHLKQLDPIDPVKYDFALCHLGISGKCPSKKSEETCGICALKNACVD